MFNIRIHFDSHIPVWLPIEDSLCFGVMYSLNRLLLLLVLTDFIEIRLFVCS